MLKVGQALVQLGPLAACQACWEAAKVHTAAWPAVSALQSDSQLLAMHKGEAAPQQWVDSLQWV